MFCGQNFPELNPLNATLTAYSIISISMAGEQYYVSLRHCLKNILHFFSPAKPGLSLVQ